jgi:hypothetical protein
MIKIGCIRTLLLAIVTSGFAFMAIAQTSDDHWPHGIMPNTEQLADSLGSINPVTGQMNMRIPLGSLSGGRAGMGIDLALNFDSNFYDRQDGNYIIPSNVGAWKYNIDNYKLELESDSSDPCRPNRLRIGLPDGSMHILHLASMPGFAMPTHPFDGFYGVSPDGIGGTEGCSDWTLPLSQKNQYEIGASEPSWLLTSELLTYPDKNLSAF